MSKLIIIFLCPVYVTVTTLANTPHNFYVRPGFRFNNRNDTQLSDILMDSQQCDQLFFQWIGYDWVQKGLMKGHRSDANLQRAYLVMRDVIDWLYPPREYWMIALSNMRDRMTEPDEIEFIDAFIKSKRKFSFLFAKLKSFFTPPPKRNI